MRVEIDGNDGTGKTSVIEILAGLGFQNIKDRGRMSAATIAAEPLEPEPGVTYFLLDGSVDTCRRHLRCAARDLNEQFHTEKDLEHFRASFKRMAERFGAVTIDIEGQTLLEIAGQIALTLNGRSLRVGVPRGHLSNHDWPWPDAMRDTFPKDSGKLWLQRMGIMVFYLRPKAIPDMAAHGLIDIGITGSDLLQDSLAQDQVEVFNKKPQRGVRLMRLRSVGSDPVKGRPLIVATTLRNIANEVYGPTGQPFIVIGVDGSTEGMCPILADEILDIVETGKTAKENQLEVVQDLGEVSIVAIRRKEPLLGYE